jgi:uncharacterized protein (TIGR02246 family)
MKRYLSVVSLALLVCFIGSCHEGQEVSTGGAVTALTDEDIATITKMGPAIDQAGLSGDFATMADMFTEDMLMMVPNGPPLEGRSAWLEWIKSMGVEMTESEYDFDVIEGYGDLAYAVATYKETFKAAGAETPIHDEGRILTILRKQDDGSWKFKYWMWASTVPLSE